LTSNKQIKESLQPYRVEIKFWLTQLLNCPKPNPKNLELTNAYHTCNTFRTEIIQKIASRITDPKELDLFYLAFCAGQLCGAYKTTTTTTVDQTEPTAEPADKETHKIDIQ